jgi:hypothetical protein
MHMAIHIRNASVTHENHDVMNGLRVLRQVVPEHCRVGRTGEMCSWVTLLRVDEMRELGWVSEKENRGIVRNQVPVPLISFELQRNHEDHGHSRESRTRLPRLKSGQ